MMNQPRNFSDYRMGLGGRDKERQRWGKAVSWTVDEPERHGSEE